MSDRDSGISPEGEVTSVVSPLTAPHHIVDVLRACPLFHNFSSTGLHLLGNIVREKSISARTPLFVEDMVAESLFIVAQGEIGISVRGSHGQALLLVSLCRGASFGEMGALCAGSRMCSAVAQTDSEVLEITRRDLGLLQQRKPQACVKLMINVNEMFALRLRESQSEFRAFLDWRLSAEPSR